VGGVDDDLFGRAEEDDQRRRDDRQPHHQREVVEIGDHRCLAVDRAVEQRKDGVAASPERAGNVRMHRQLWQSMEQALAAEHLT